MFPYYLFLLGICFFFKSSFSCVRLASFIRWWWFWHRRRWDKSLSETVAEMLDDLYFWFQSRLWYFDMLLEIDDDETFSVNGWMRIYNSHNESASEKKNKKETHLDGSFEINGNMSQCPSMSLHWKSEIQNSIDTHTNFQCSRVKRFILEIWLYFRSGWSEIDTVRNDI